MFPERHYAFSIGEREMAIEHLARGLTSRDDVLFAFVHGSILSELPFHDIDVAVFLSGEARAGQTQRALELGRILTDALRDAGFGAIPVDTRALNDASVGFCYHTSRGRLIAVRDENCLTSWLADVASRCLDSRPLRERALKEAMAA